MGQKGQNCYSDYSVLLCHLQGTLQGWDPDWDNMEVDYLVLVLLNSFLGNYYLVCRSEMVQQVGEQEVQDMTVAQDYNDLQYQVIPQGFLLVCDRQDYKLFLLIQSF